MAAKLEEWCSIRQAGAQKQRQAESERERERGGGTNERGRDEERHIERRTFTVLKCKVEE